MKAFIRSIAAAIVFIALLVYVFAHERGRVPDQKEVFGLNVTEVAKLEITGSGSDMVLESRDGDWHVAKPFKGLANSDEAERRVKALTELKPSGTRSGVDLDDEKFGLKEPRLTAVLHLANGKPDIKLMIGKDTPVGSEVYAKIEGKKDLYILSSTVFSALKQSADSLHERKLVKLEADKVRSLVLTHGDTKIAAENRPDDGKDKWFLTAPISARADEFQTEQLVSKLTGLEAKEFAEEAGKDTEYGFDKPSVRAELVDEDGKMTAITIGAQSDQTASGDPESGKLFYAKADGRDEILLVPPQDVNELRKQPIDLRDKSIVELDKQNINYVRVQAKKRLSFAITRLPDGWHLDRPQKGVAKAAKVDDMLWDIIQLEAREYVEQAPKDLKQYGLAIPDTMIEVQTIDGKEPLKIKIGYAHGDDGHYCQTSQSEDVYVISDMLLLDLPTKLEDIKSSS